MDAHELVTTLDLYVHMDAHELAAALDLHIKNRHIKIILLVKIRESDKESTDTIRQNYYTHAGITNAFEHLCLHHKRVVWHTVGRRQMVVRDKIRALDSENRTVFVDGALPRAWDKLDFSVLLTTLETFDQPAFMRMFNIHLAPTLGFFDATAVFALHQLDDASLAIARECFAKIAPTRLVEFFVDAWCYGEAFERGDFLIKELDP